MKKKCKTKQRTAWEEMSKTEIDHPVLAGSPLLLLTGSGMPIDPLTDAHARGDRNPPKPRLTSEMVREILEPPALTLQAAELVMPMLRPKKITYQHLWTMLGGVWKLRRELHPKSKSAFEDIPKGARLEFSKMTLGEAFDMEAKHSVLIGSGGTSRRKSIDSGNNPRRRRN